MREGVTASEEECKFAPVQAVPEQGVLDLHVREEAELPCGGFDLGHHLLQCVSHERAILWVVDWDAQDPDT
jgi:hypothetical protein